MVVDRVCIVDETTFEMSQKAYARLDDIGN